MSAFDLNQASTPFEEIDDDRERDHLQIHNSNSNSFSCPNIFAATLHHQSADYCMSYQFHQLQQEPKELFFIPGSSDRAIPHPTDNIKLSLCDPYGAAEDEAADRAGKYWMSSKMRLMRKMMNSTTQIIMSKSMENMTASGDHGYNANDNRSSNDSNSPGSVVRVCSDCKTTKTPLWRSGPRGPKSLCNACGIRQRKARRAMAAAAALNGAVIPAAAASVKVRKEKKLDIDRTLPFKKRCKMNYTATATTTNTSTTAAAKKLCFEEHVTLGSSKNSAAPAIQKAFPEDERDAAVLLMALSCGLIRS